MISYQDIITARDNLHPEIINTPLEVWRHGSIATGRDVRLKIETLQRTGSFKPRGAWNRMRLLNDSEKARGVVTASAGNHAQGVALAAQLIGTRATIVMPMRTPEIKIIQTRLYNDPEIILFGDSLHEAARKARKIGNERDLVYIHPYDDEAVMAGQGTIGLEILEAWPEVDTIIVPVGGGGIISGIAVAVFENRKDIKIIGVQTEKADAAIRAIKLGRPVRVKHSPSIADGINVSKIGEHPFEIVQKFKIPIYSVTEEEISESITALCQTAKLVVEPAGAAPAALALFHQELISDRKNIVCVLSGANIDIARFAEILKSHPMVPAVTAAVNQ